MSLWRRKDRSLRPLLWRRTSTVTSAPPAYRTGFDSFFFFAALPNKGPSHTRESALLEEPRDEYTDRVASFVPLPLV